MFKNKIILFMLLSTIVLFANVKLEIFKAAAPQYIEGDRIIHYTLIVTDDSVSETYPMPITINDNIKDGTFIDSDINITNYGGFDCDINTSNLSSEIECNGTIESAGGIIYINYDVLAPDEPGQITNEASVSQNGTEIDTASMTVTIFPEYDIDLDYNRDLCYIPSSSSSATCSQSGAFFYGSDCNTSVIVKRNNDADIPMRSLGNVHIFKAYTSEIESDDCYTDIGGGGRVDCGTEQDIEELLHKTSSLYLELAFNQAHDFSFGDFVDTTNTDENRTIIDINTEPSSNQVTFFEYIALIGQYNIAGDTDNTIEEYIYPCDRNYSSPGITIQETAVGLNDVNMSAGDTLEDQAEYINYATYSKVGTKIVNQPFVLGVTYLDAAGEPADYNGTYATGKTINAPVLLQYEANGNLENLWSGELVHGDQHILTLENFSNDANIQESYPVIIEAFRSGQIQIRLIDYGNFFRSVDGLSCGASSLDSSLCLLPGCLNSAEQITGVFPIENYPHVAQCVYGDGGGAAPCDSNAYNGGCGGIKETISPDKYNHDLGCMHCLADAITPDIYSDPFSTRPKDFSLEVPDLDGDGLFRAGLPYPIDLNATTGDDSITRSPYYNPTLEGNDYPSKVIAVIGLEENLSLTCPYDDNESQEIVFNNGYSASPISYSNVGKTKLVIMDQNWTSIDQNISNPNASDCILDSNETNPVLDLLGLGRVGCMIKAEQNLTFVPYEFGIDANLTDHNNDNNFTYLHDINQYDNDDNYSMAAELSVFIEALNQDGNVTSNYIEGCYAKDTNLTLILHPFNITYPGDQPLEHFLYYNPKEDTDPTEDDMGEGNASLPLPVGKTITVTSLPMENNATTFPSDGTEENGTTHIGYKLNFDRKIHLVVNPFKMTLNDLNMTDEDGVREEDPVTITNPSATMYYARTIASQFFYDDTKESSRTTPILIDVYCNLGFTQCNNLGLSQTNESNWWLSLGHDKSNEDGNITLKEGGILAGNSDDWNVTSNVNITVNAIDDTITVSRGTVNLTLPLTVEIDLDTTNPTDTNRWLIYNEDTDSILQAPPSPLYKVRFIGHNDWVGHGDTGHVVDSNISTKKNRRLGW